MQKSKKNQEEADAEARFLWTADSMKELLAIMSASQ